jgi:uncharacterized linocin/CFP29 family protein
MMGPNAALDAGNAILTSSSGRWAGEQFMAAMRAGKELNAEVLRTNGVLGRDEWIFFDTELIEATVARLQGVADLIAAGLTKFIPNSMGKTVMQYDRTGDLADASVSMDGMVRTENDRPAWSYGQLPIPITHKDWFIPLRSLQASRNSGEALDSEMIRKAGRKIAEMQETMLFQGGKQFGGLPIYGYLTHPDRHTVTHGTGGLWSDPAKTGDQMYNDVQAMIALARGDRQYGPYVLYHGTDSAANLDKDFKANGTLTVRQRLLQIQALSDIREADFLPAGNLLLVQMTRDTVVLVQGEPLQNVQWDIQGGFGVEFKSFQIQVPLIRAMDGQSGLVHMSGTT